MEAPSPNREAFAAAFKTMHDAKKQMQEMILLPTLDVGALEEAHALYVESKRVVDESYARSAAAHEEKQRRENQLRAERRAQAEKMSKAQLVDALGFCTERDRQVAMRRTHRELVDFYADLIPPGS